MNLYKYKSMPVKKLPRICEGCEGILGFKKKIKKGVGCKLRYNIEDKYNKHERKERV